MKTTAIFALTCAAVSSALAAQSDWDTSKVYLEGANVPGTAGSFCWNTSATSVKNGWAVWWRYNTDTSTWEKSTESCFTSASDNLCITVDSMNETDVARKSGLLYYAASNTVGSLEVIGNAITYIQSPYSKGCMLTIVGDFKRTGAGTFSFKTRGYPDVAKGYMDGSVNIGGNAIFGNGEETDNAVVYFGVGGTSTTGNYAGPLKTVYVDKDMIFNGTKCSARFNVGLNDYSPTYNIDTPDITVMGIVNAPKQGIIHINERGGTYTGSTTVMSIGGASGNVIFRNNSNSVTDNALSILVFNNAAGTMLTCSGIIYDDANSYNVAGSTEEGQSLGFNSHSKVGVVMNGEGTQILSNSGRMKFSGGVTVNKGTLLVNARSSSAAYIDNPDGTRTYQATHGDLIMRGGAFGFMSNASGAGNWTFNDMLWKSGKLIFNVYDSSVDQMVFAGMFGLDEGTFGQIELLFNGNSIYALTSERKVLVWDSFDEAITSDSFFAENFFDGTLGGEYKAQFRAAADGLYVQYVAVPEPAALALLFGAMALGFSVWRRRK